MAGQLSVAGLWSGVSAPVLGLALLVLIWEMVSLATGSIPTPRYTFARRSRAVQRPFCSKGPNDQGVGWNVLSAASARLRLAAVSVFRSAS
jgi:nitrate/nitrite transport system permease protein